MKVPTSEIGIVINGIIVALMFCKKTKTTMVTSINASMNVFSIS